jgi:branched-chain amino acid transport system permease protein
MFLQQLINGLTIGSIYALVTIGFSMVWSILQLANFAHGSFYMLGPYLVLTSVLLLGNTPLTFIVVVLIISIFTACLGAGMDRVLLRPIREKKVSNISTILCTIGVQTVINNGIIAIYGSQSRAFPAPFEMETISIGNAVVSWMQIIIFCLAVVLMLALSWIVYRTKLGVAMRSISQNSRAASIMGINVNRVIMITFFIGTFVAAVAGCMVGLYYQVIDTTMATVTGSKSMAAAILGGIGVLPGAVVGGLIIGVLETMVAAYVSSGYRDAIAFAILIIVLIVRPTGILGKKAVNKV